MVNAIDTPAELLRPESFLPAFQQPTPISRKAYLDIIYRRAVVLGISDEDFKKATDARIFRRGRCVRQGGTYWQRRRSSYHSLRPSA